MTLEKKNTISARRLSNGNNTEKRNLDSSIREGAFSVASTNMTQNYVIPFAIALGASNYYISVVVMLQNLGTALGQIPGARMADLFSRKTIWTFSHVITRFMWMALPLIFFMPGDRVMMFAMAIFLIFFLNGFRNPSWSSLMSDIVPEAKRGEFFGKRNMIAGICGLIALTASGLIVSYFGFGALFPLAGIVGLIAVVYFSRITEPSIKKRFIYRHSFSINVRNLLFSIRFHPDFFAFTFYMFFISMAIAVASPFYAIKMLKAMDIGYLWYSFVLIVEVIVTIISQPYWGRLCDSYGNKMVLIVTGIMICFIPFTWIFANSIISLIVVSIYNGFIYGGWTMITFNYLIGTVPSGKKESYIANHTFLIGFGTIFGTFIGGYLSGHMETLPLGEAISIILFTSFILRLLASSLLWKIGKITLNQTNENIDTIMVKSLIVEPGKGLQSFFDYLSDPEWVYRTARNSAREFYRAIAYKIKIRLEH